MTKWKVELYNPHLQDWRTKKVQAPDRPEARTQGLEGESEGWEVDELQPICDFCEPVDETPALGTARIVVIDPADVEDDPDRAEAPTRIAWVCKHHHEAVGNLDTA